MKWSRRGGVWIRDIRGRCGRGQIHFQAEKIQQRCQKIIAQDIADQKQIDDPQILKGFEKVGQTERDQQTDYNEDQKDRMAGCDHDGRKLQGGRNLVNDVFLTDRAFELSDKFCQEDPLKQLADHDKDRDH